MPVPVTAVTCDGGHGRGGGGGAGGAAGPAPVGPVPGRGGGYGGGGMLTTLPARRGTGSGGWSGGPGGGGQLASGRGGDCVTSVTGGPPCPGLRGAHCRCCHTQARPHGGRARVPNNAGTTGGGGFLARFSRVRTVCVVTKRDPRQRAEGAGGASDPDGSQEASNGTGQGTASGSRVSVGGG